MATEQEQLDQAVTDGGAYDVIRARLLSQASTLKTKVDKLNNARIEEFGQAKLEVAGRVRVRTENNCVARDIVPVGQDLLFGYNVFIGLKKETQVSDVFSLFQLQEKEGSYQLNQKDIKGSFLDEPNFVKEFNELYIYYKEARLIQIKVQNQTLFAVFQIGRKLEDIRVFQWQIEKDGSARYIDNRGERAIKKADSHDFEWELAGRDSHESGSHPHINILDEVFVETIGGKLTIKVENNTEDGLGIYNEDVDDSTQSLADASVHYAKVGSLILLKILPYREKEHRYLVYNTRNQQVNRIDAIGSACISLPEDHGIIFPGGYYLQNGDTKKFPDEIEGLTFKRSMRSPNGEDVLFIFYEPESGLAGLYSYNLIRKELQNPIYAHGFSIFDDGKMVIFSSEEEATRVHPMQVWETPYYSDEFAAKQPSKDSFYSRIGNKELVRGISDVVSIYRNINSNNPSRSSYEDLIKTSKSMFDSYYWMTDDEVDGLGDLIKEISNTAELVIDEFEKVEQIRQQATNALAEAEKKQQEVIAGIRISSWKTPQEYVDCLMNLRKQRGFLVTLKDQRYIDTERISELDEKVTEAFDEVSTATVSFLSDEAALKPYTDAISTLDKRIASADLVVVINEVNEELESLSLGLDLLTEVLNGLKIDDATKRTKILDDISEIYSKLNKVKAQGRNRRKQLGSSEATAEFAAQFRLFSQSINSALAMADTPDKAEEQLSRLLIQLEELESKFSEFDEFLSDIMEKREELHSAFESRKQSLMEEQQRKAQNLFSAAQRILKGVSRRAGNFADATELNTYFASDPMIMKIAELAQQLRDLNDQIKADDLEAQLKAVKEQGIRSLRDKQDIFEDGGNVIKLGKHKFSVNTQSLDLTLLPRDDGLYRHLVGTDFYERIENEELSRLKPYWQQNLVSENAEVSRAEFLVSVILKDAEEQRNGLSLASLYEQSNDAKALSAVIREYMTARYQEGYEKGIHDSDALAILQAILPIHQQAGLLRFAPKARALAMLFWIYDTADAEQRLLWQSHAQSAAVLSSSFSTIEGFKQLRKQLEEAMKAFTQDFKLQPNPANANTSERSSAENNAELNALLSQAVEYLSLELAQSKLCFVSSQAASDMTSKFSESISKLGHQSDFDSAMLQFNTLITNSKKAYQLNQTNNIHGLTEQWSLTCAWIEATLGSKNNADKDAENDQAQIADGKSHYIEEAAALVIAAAVETLRSTQKSLNPKNTEDCAQSIETMVSSISLEAEISDLLSDHQRIKDGKLRLSVDEFNQRLGHYHSVHVNNFKRYHELRQRIMDESRKELQLEAYNAKPLSSFVRNRLINEVYLPIIGDNLAKQMGTVGDNKRTDLMGLLLLISPPGYGKTTLMEYTADRLGLVFMKINCPSLGHDVTSIDPENAPNATAKQELEKLNLGLEMGNNVMLYLDDIQHTHPEFLQKFIALCDGTRRIEGVWKGESKTYDMRGKKFCVVMAGNPYTESGDVFKVPDMLANRADIYNLGDVLGGQEEQFALSYIENALTSNPVLAPLALRDMQDVYKFVAMANGENIPSADLSHQYSGAEINEIVAVLRHLIVIQEVILKVNLQYIESAATAEDYRQEPPFKLQGSYRNMNKMTEKVSAVMNHDELMRLIGDHYTGEAQTLTSGAEENLLKLAMLRGVMTDEQTQRWEHICSAFDSKQSQNIEGDPQVQAVKQLSQMTKALEAIKVDMQQTVDTGDLIRPINRVAAAMQLLSKVWAGNGASKTKDLELEEQSDKPDAQA
ncbi:DNA repair ATPase [Glaciecola sp. MH2013]|uniref:DNA repair ATPase n=1 Tax=Glaciecola sp. MH2013 TaxID=2785524 RepID=UPI0018A096F3|nr:DNA repair ATPase [Glaciecola sp. MH2013]MBF7074146.1 DNA repair ATPase [Glaciecola sp. MH2013]